MLELLSFGFFQNALIAGALVSLACGLVGVLVMINRLFSMAGGVTHAAFGGIGLAFYFGWPVLFCTSVFTLVLAFLVAFLSARFAGRSDSLIAVLWAFGMALGIILIDLSPGYAADLMAYLFGSILAVSGEDLLLMAGVDAAAAVLILLFYRQFEALSFDEPFARTRGVRTGLFHYLLIALMSFCIVLCMRLVGLILVLALLSIPSFIAEFFVKRLGAMMILAAVLSALFCLGGLVLSFYLDLSSGACIVGCACAGFVLVLLFRMLRPRTI